jgi:hypothetical protein
MQRGAAVGREATSIFTRDYSRRLQDRRQPTPGTTVLDLCVWVFA